MDRMNAYVDSMVRCLQQISHNKYNVYTVEKVVKSGSLGKGTATSDSDIDLVVYFNGLHNIQDLERARPTLLNLIEAEVAQLNWRQFLGRMVMKKKTTHSVCYILYGTGIDILPAFDAQRELGSPSNIYQAMSQYHGPPAKAAQQYSASLATLQVEFVKQADNRVKEVIRRLKEWKESNGLDIRAYSLELLAIYCHQPSMSVGQLHKKCLEQLSNIENLRVAFDDYYQSAQYTRNLTPPYILDPVNPLNNTLRGVDMQTVSWKATLAHIMINTLPASSLESWPSPTRISGSTVLRSEVRRGQPGHETAGQLLLPLQQSHRYHPFLRQTRRLDPVRRAALPDDPLRRPCWWL